MVPGPWHSAVLVPGSLLYWYQVPGTLLRTASFVVSMTPTVDYNQ